jgi:predicted ester cyclase
MENSNLNNPCSETARDNISLVKQFIQKVWNERRIDIIEEIFSPDFIGHYDYGMITGINAWREKIYNHFLQALPDLLLEGKEFVGSGRSVIVRWTGVGTHTGKWFDIPPSHTIVQLSGIYWVTITDGKISAIRGESNMSYLIRQLLQEVKQLKGILPICCACGLIRDDTSEKEKWIKMDRFLSEKTDVQISHTYCPACHHRAMDKIS